MFGKQKQEIGMITNIGFLAPNVEFISFATGKTLFLNDFQNTNIILLIYSSELLIQLEERLIEYIEKIDSFSEKNARLVIITDAGEYQIKNFGNKTKLEANTFRIIGNFQRLLNQFDFSTQNNDQKKTLVILIDKNFIVRRVFESVGGQLLPRPTQIERALIGLISAPIPPIVTTDDWIFGENDAPITIIEYFDYECRACSEMHEVIKTICGKYSSKVKLVLRHFPLNSTHPLSQISAEAAEAAGNQGKFWEMHNRLFLAKGDLDENSLKNYAMEIGLDIDKFTFDLHSQKYKSKIRESFKQAVINKITLPPTIFINGIYYSGQRSIQAMSNEIDRILNKLNPI